MRLVFVAAAALIDAQGRVLLAKRPEGKALAGLWEFPGGKLEPGETPEQALVRELEEELAVRIDPEALTPYLFASHAYPDFHLFMPLYQAHEWDGRPHPREGQEIAWFQAEALSGLPTPPADVSLMARLANDLKAGRP